MLKIIKSWSIPFVILLSISWFIFRFITSEEQTSRWCENCQTYHDINDETVEEIWCNNCNTWHLPNDESKTQAIK